MDGELVVMYDVNREEKAGELEVSENRVQENHHAEAKGLCSCCRNSQASGQFPAAQASVELQRRTRILYPYMSLCILFSCQENGKKGPWVSCPCPR